MRANRGVTRTGGGRLESGQGGVRESTKGTAHAKGKPKGKSLTKAKRKPIEGDARQSSTSGTKRASTKDSEQRLPRRQKRASKRRSGDPRPRAEAGWLRLEPGDELVVRVPGKGRFRTRIVERLDERTPDEGTKMRSEKAPKPETQQAKPNKRGQRKRTDALDRRLPGSFGAGKRR